MKPLKDYVEIIFAVLALAVLVFVFWYFLVAVPRHETKDLTGKHLELEII